MPNSPGQQGPPPRWRVLVTPRWLGWHVFAVAAIAGMIWLGDWQFHRAIAGNTLSWAYTFEWPIFAVLGIVFWAKTIRDELHPVPAAGSEPAPVNLPAGSRPGARNGAAPDPDTEDGPNESGESDESDDPELAEYNAYLARLANEAKGHGKWHGLR